MLIVRLAAQMVDGENRLALCQSYIDLGLGYHDHPMIRWIDGCYEGQLDTLK